MNIQHDFYEVKNAEGEKAQRCRLCNALCLPEDYTFNLICQEKVKARIKSFDLEHYEV